MMNVPQRRSEVDEIVNKLTKPSENSADAVKAHNEETAETPLNESVDEISPEVAMEAAATSLQAALESKDYKAIAIAIQELFELFSLGKG